LHRLVIHQSTDGISTVGPDECSGITAEVGELPGFN
jgi:hypothetical protein